ncbi:MAG: large-conductance mechanosensitive channel protein MscL [Bacteroidota bacterium]
MLEEFKKFAMRGNVMDMAVGIILGGAFGAIVSSLVSDVLMPPIGVLLGGMDFGSLSLIVKEATGDAPAVTLRYGAFLNTIINFLIIAFAIFMMVKGMNSLKKKEETPAGPPPPPPRQEVLLTEIRDLLRKG